MPAQDFRFPFDAEKVQELFAAVKLPVFDAEAAMAAQQKNIDAMIEANKVFAEGYQALYKRQVAMLEAAFAEARGMFQAAQGQPMTAEQAGKNVETMQAAFEKAAADFRELAEIAEKANAGAFAIVKARVEAAIGEFQAAAEKIAA